MAKRLPRLAAPSSYGRIRIPSLKLSAPEMFQNMDITEPNADSSVDGLAITLRRVIRDNSLDSVGFEVELANKGGDRWQYRERGTFVNQGDLGRERDDRDNPRDPNTASARKTQLSSDLTTPAVLYFPPEVLGQLNELCELCGLTPAVLICKAIESQDARFDQFIHELMRGAVRSQRAVILRLE